jgi:PRC-barrel domain protein
MTETLVGEKLHDCNGVVIGKIDDLVVDPATLEPEWVQVHFGLLRDRTLVPAGEVYRTDDFVACQLTKDVVKRAPSVHDPNPDSATRKELLRYYGVEDPKLGRAN